MIFKMRATGNVAWGVAVTSLVGVLGLVTIGLTTAPVTGGTSAAVSSLVALPVATGAVSVLGVSGTGALIGVAAAGGGIKAVNKLRGYRVEKISSNKVILHKK